MSAKPFQWQYRYVDYLLGQLGLSETTLRLYVRHVRDAWEWCEARGLRLTSLQAQDGVDPL